MSQRNGDRARADRKWKEKILKRSQLREYLKAKALASKSTKPEPEKDAGVPAVAGVPSDR